MSDARKSMVAVAEEVTRLAFAVNLQTLPEGTPESPLSADSDHLSLRSEMTPWASIDNLTRLAM
jgi:hypothetical protein